MMSTHDGLWKYHLASATKKALLTEYYHHRHVITTIEQLAVTINGSTQRKLMRMHAQFETDLARIVEEMGRRGLVLDDLNGDGRP